MKTLFDIINESREYFHLDIPLEDMKSVFKIFAIEDDEPEEHIDEVYKKMKKWIPDNISPDTLMSVLMAYFYSPKGMNGKYSDKGVEMFMEFINNQPLERVEKVLGAGGEGMVISIGGGKVMKIMFDADINGRNKRMLDISRNMVGKTFETLPNVYKVTKNIIIRDDVMPATKKCIEYYNISKSQYADCPFTLEQLIMKDNLSKAFEVTGRKLKLKPVVKWLYKLRKELMSIGMLTDKSITLGDFKPANLGETKDGRVVYYDW